MKENDLLRKLSTRKLMDECLIGFGEGQTERLRSAAMELARRGAVKEKIGGNEYTALHLTLMGRVPNSGLDEASLALLEKGASPTAVSREGTTPLLMALQTGAARVAEELLKRGASMTERDDYGLGPFGHMSLFGSKASDEEKASCAYLALSKGAKPNLEMPLNGKSVQEMLEKNEARMVLDLIRSFEEAEALKGAARANTPEKRKKTL